MLACYSVSTKNDRRLRHDALIYYFFCTQDSSVGKPKGEAVSTRMKNIQPTVKRDTENKSVDDVVVETQSEITTDPVNSEKTSGQGNSVSQQSDGSEKQPDSAVCHAEDENKVMDDLNPQKDNAERSQANENQTKGNQSEGIQTEGNQAEKNQTEGEQAERNQNSQADRQIDHTDSGDKS